MALALHRSASRREVVTQWCRRTWLKTVGLFVPPSCVYCGTDINHTDSKPLLCDRCVKVLAPEVWQRCSRCGSLVDEPHKTTRIASSSSASRNNRCPGCRNSTYHFDEVVSLGHYRDQLRLALLQMKTRVGDPLSRAMGELLVQRRADELARFKPDVVVPIPMHWWPRFKRGTCSPEIMAQRISRHLGVPFERAMLVRHRNTVPQADLSPTKRFENVRGAFRLGRGYDIKSSRILLVDDIMTTGATCSEAAKVLKKSGAAAVLVAIAARTEGKQ